MPKMGRLLCFLGFFSFGHLVASEDGAWVWLYTKRFTSKQMRNNARHKNVTFKRHEIPHFSQLLFSWNAFRPKKGYFSFFVRGRQANSKQWSSWYKMMDWGAKIQRSYGNFSRGKVRYVYVRLEMDRKNLADAFMVKIVPREGADFSTLKGISVCTVNMTKFRPEKLTRSLLQLPSTQVKNVPRLSQQILKHSRAQHMCSTTSCSMLVGLLTNKMVDPLDFAQHALDSGLNAYGSWPFNVAHAFERCGGKYFFSVTRLLSFHQLYRYVHRGIPVVVSVRGYLRGAPKVYNKGHLLLVVGWDTKRKQVICHDPAFKTNRKVLKRYDIGSFLSAWERSHRLAYIAERNLVG